MHEPATLLKCVFAPISKQNCLIIASSTKVQAKNRPMGLE